MSKLYEVFITYEDGFETLFKIGMAESEEEAKNKFEPYWKSLLAVKLENGKVYKTEQIKSFSYYSVEE